jgi:hypothetical protein
MTILHAYKMIRQLRIIVILSVFIAPIGVNVAAADATVYSDILEPGWVNWSWNTTLNFSNTSPVQAGSRSLSVKYEAGWAGLYLHTDTGFDTSLYDRLSFWLHGGSAGNQRLVIVANGNTANSYQITAQANAWTQVIVPMSALGSPAVLTDLYWQDATGGAQPVFYLDGIILLGGSAPPPPPLSLHVDAGAERHLISEDIYGMNFANEALAAELRLPVRRWGGNSTTRYNWQTSMTNTASDWYFENLPEGSVNVANLPDGSASDQFVEQDRRTGTKSILTVPMIGWTVKSTSPRNHPYDCGFKVSKYGSQQSVDSWDSDCGNGIRSGGGNITDNNPTDTSDPIDSTFVSAWIAHLTGKYGTAADNGVAYYNLDNEPMLWNSTHRDVHPQPVSYDEMRDRTLQYAAAVKTADPSAKTLGPVLWGWCAYFYSALDGCGIGPDYQSHGNLPFVPWYLSQLRDYEQQHGQRLLDFLDLHYYPQASGVALSTAGSTATQALRLRSTRSLWDPNYTDESWISDTQSGGVKVQLIGRMRAWVDTYYPGTRLALTEYNWGGLESLNGALAQAEVLGIFGREGLDLATLWSPPLANQPGAYAFRMFRNYDGLGHGFGDTGLQAVSSNPGELSIYAAQRSSDNALTVMVINKTASDLTGPIGVAGLALPPTAAVYRYSTADLNAIVHLQDQAVSESGFNATYPAKSITLFVLAASGANNATLTVTKAGTGSGSIASDSGTLAWNGNTGTAAYSSGMPVTLTATAGVGSVFGGWAGCDSSSGTSCSVTMTSAKAVTATFTLNQYLLTVNASGSGTGSVTSGVGGINYTYQTTQTASALLDHGSMVQITAAGSNGSTVVWSNGACDSVSGTADNSVCTINSMNAAKTLSATFTAGTCTFSISPTSKTFTKNGGSGSINTTASSSGCSWSAVSNVPWATISGSTFTGNATVNYSVSRNRTGSSRSGTFTIAGKTFTIIQSK